MIEGSTVSTSALPLLHRLAIAYLILPVLIWSTLTSIGLLIRPVGCYLGIAYGRF